MRLWLPSLLMVYFEQSGREWIDPQTRGDILSRPFHMQLIFYFLLQFNQQDALTAVPWMDTLA